MSNAFRYIIRHLCNVYKSFLDFHFLPFTENKHEDNFYGGTVTDLDKCITIAGPDSYAPCISPFIYKGILHKTCSLIDAKPDAPWCPTKVDNKGHAILGKGKWGICGPECPIPPGKKYVINLVYHHNSIYMYLLILLQKISASLSLVQILMYRAFSHSSIEELFIGHAV